MTKFYFEQDRQTLWRENLVGQRRMTDNQNPEGVRVMSWAQIENLGVNEATGELYWRGRPVETKRPLVLSSWQNLSPSSSQPSPSWAG
ncbi:hypothetical protein [Bradyrhizobium sp. C9]|uniref:hypothetical protein n=1 Tax=Bradyrhizobium sp. C9 TaxID=142585 RepID=UPI00117748DF|nr:hypothetical protein [Bradyrhizobium sp. C9]